MFEEDQSADAILNERSQNSTLDVVTGPKAEEDGHLSMTAGLVVLLLTTILVSFCADYLVGSIDEIVESSGCPKHLLG